MLKENRMSYDPKRYEAINYKKTKIKTKPKKVGQVFFLVNGNKPAIVNARVTMADGFYSTGKPKTKTIWHYAYLSTYRATKGEYYGRSCNELNMVEAEYIGNKNE